MTDTELLQAWHTGDRRAGKALFERHYLSLARFFRNKTNEPADLVHCTFLACLEHIDRFRGDASFRTYLFSIANNVLRNHYRVRRGPDGRVDFDTISVVDLEPSPTDQLDRLDEERLLLCALRRLSIEEQILLELYYWEQMKLGEMAEVLDLPVGTVKTRMRTARRRLKGFIAELAASPSLARSTSTRLEQWAEAVRGRYLA